MKPHKRCSIRPGAKRSPASPSCVGSFAARPTRRRGKSRNEGPGRFESGPQPPDSCPDRDGGGSWCPRDHGSRLRFGMSPPDAKAKIAFELNGEPVEVAFAPHKTLLEVLREDLGLTGTKHGCELGECGTCTVLVDGAPVLSCLVLGLACAGRRVKTVEGMAEGGKLHPLQHAFAELGAAQCGYRSEE